jgi:VWFA-related protein
LNKPSELGVAATHRVIGLEKWVSLGGVAVLVAVLSQAAWEPAQAQNAAPESRFRVSVDRVQIGAVVTDSKGRPLTDLRIADFRVSDGGKQQQITNCEYVLVAAPGQAPTAWPRGQSSTAPPTRAGHEMGRNQLRRTIVFLLDDESFAATTIPAVREAVRRTVDGTLEPGDLSALIRTSSGNGSLEQFTSDKRILLDSAAKIRWTPGSRANPGLLPQTSGAVLGEDVGKYLVADSVNRTRSVLEYVISALQGLPGRKQFFLSRRAFQLGRSTPPRKTRRRRTLASWSIRRYEPGWSSTPWIPLRSPVLPPTQVMM